MMEKNYTNENKIIITSYFRRIHPNMSIFKMCLIL